MSDSCSIIISNNKPESKFLANSNEPAKRLNNYRHGERICLCDDSSFMLMKKLGINCKDRTKMLEYKCSKC